MTGKKLRNKNKKNKKEKVDLKLLIDKIKKTGQNKKKDKDSGEINKSGKIEDNDSGKENRHKTEKSSWFDFGDLESSQVSWSSEQIKTPVLERIAQKQPEPIFVGSISQGQPVSKESEEAKRDFKYVSNFREDNEPKYSSTSEKIEMTPGRADFSRVGREPASFSRPIQEVPFVKSYETDIESSRPEKAWQLERFDSEKAGRENPIEREEIKYKKYKPNLPER